MAINYLEEQIRQIVDVSPAGRISVIVQTQPDESLVSYLQTSAKTMRERRSFISARELLPPPRTKVDRPPKSDAAQKSRWQPTAAVQAYRKLDQSLKAESSAQKDRLQSMISSDWLQSTIPRSKAKGKKASSGVIQPVNFTISGSLVLELTRDQLLHLPKQLPHVAEIFPNRLVRVPSTSKSAKLPAVVADNKAYTYGISRTGALSTWGCFGARGSNVKVAVLDTGVNPTHEDLRGKIADFVEFDDQGQIVRQGLAKAHDDNGHGTHCSGTICGGNASGRYIGMAPDATILSVKVLTKGSGTDAQILAGLDWAIRNGANVINMSLGALRMSADVLDTYTLTLFNANRLGIPVVVAVGNEGSQTTGSPGNDFFAFTVGATDVEDRAAGFSGGRTQIIESSRYLKPEYLPLVYSKPDVTAPGVEIYSAVRNGKHEAWNGTSMATPHVAGAMALLLSPEFSIRELSGKERTDTVQSFLMSSGRELGESGQNHRYGYGRLDVLRACGFARDLGY